MENTRTIVRICPVCGDSTAVIVRRDAYRRWREGAYIQDALGMLTVTERETLLSGFCPCCQESFFAEDED